MDHSRCSHSWLYIYGMEGKQMTTICNQCNGNHYIKVRKIWKDATKKERVWIIKPCPKCVPITEEELDDDTTLDVLVERINQKLKMESYLIPMTKSKKNYDA